MIKNDAQLKRTHRVLREVRERVYDLERRYSGIELETLAAPVIDFAEDLEREISEYRELRQSSLDQAVAGPLSEPMLLDNVAQLLSKLRIAAGLTQADLAERLGWRQSNLSRFESAAYSSQTIAKVVEYAAALGVYLHVSPCLAEKPGQGAPAVLEEEATQAADATLQPRLARMLWQLRCACGDQCAGMRARRPGPHPVKAALRLWRPVC